MQPIPPQRPNQPPQYPQPQPGIQAPPPYSMPPVKKRKSRKKLIAIIVGVFVFLLGSFIAIGLYGETLPQAKTTTVATAAPTHARLPTVNPTNAPIPTTKAIATTAPATVGPPVLGATLESFTAKYGKMNSHSDPAQGQYYLSVYGNDKNDITLQFIYGKQVSAILYGAPEPKLWSESEAKAACAGFLPHDATYQRKILFPSTTASNPPDEQLVYIAPSLASLFPASAFTDEKGNQAKPGTVALILSHWDANTFVQCVLQVGLQAV